MFDKLSSPPKKVVAHIKRRKTAYAATAGAITGAVIMRKLDRETYGAAMAFLEEKGLTDEFFNQEI